MDPTHNNGLGLNPSDNAGAVNAATAAAGGFPTSLPSGIGGGTTAAGAGTNGGIPNQQLMSSLMGQLSQHHPQMQGLAGAGGVATRAPGQGAALANQVPLLVGQTPLQQQLAALQGLTASSGGGQAAVAGGGPVNNLSDAALLFSGAQGQQLQQSNQNTITNQPGFPQQVSAAQSLGQAQQQQQQQQQPQQLQQLNNMGMAGGLGVMAQNPLFGTASMGFNVQQLQQLQLAQQLMAAGLPAHLAFGMGGGAGGGLGGLGGQGPQSSLAALAASNSMAGLGGMTGPNALGGGQATMGASAATAAGLTSHPLAAASGMVKSGVGGGTTTIGEGQEWAEPFSGKGKKEPPFPLKLHQILSNPEFQECICWNSHGRSWRILKPPVFEQLVIPLYFRHAKYASFMRQVNGWGFKRIVSGNDHNSYYHEMFVRDYPHLCLKMKRIRKDKISEAVEEQEAKAAEVVNPEGNLTSSAGGVLPESNEVGGRKTIGTETEEDGNEDQNPPSNAVKAMLNSGAPGSSVGLTSSMGQATSGTPSSGSQGGRSDTAALLAGASAQLQNQQPSAGQIPSGGLDGNAIAKLQEALQGGAAGGTASLFGQQPQAQSSQTLSGLLGPNMGSLSGILGGNINSALAAQLQAATQPPAPSTANSASSAQTIQEMVAKLHEQQPNQPKGDSA